MAPHTKHRTRRTALFTYRKAYFKAFGRLARRPRLCLVCGTDYTSGCFFQLRKPQLGHGSLALPASASRALAAPPSEALPAQARPRERRQEL